MKILRFVCFTVLSLFAGSTFAVTAKVNLNVTMTGLSTVGQLPVKNPSSNCPSVQGPRASTFEALKLGANWQCGASGSNTWHCQYTTTLTGSTPTDGSSTPVYLKVTSYHPNGTVQHGMPKTAPSCESIQAYPVLAIDHAGRLSKGPVGDLTVNFGYYSFDGNERASFRQGLPGLLTTAQYCAKHAANEAIPSVTFSSGSVSAWNAYVSRFKCVPKKIFVACKYTKYWSYWYYNVSVPLQPPAGGQTQLMDGSMTCSAPFSTQTAWLGFNVPNSGSMLNANAFGGSVSTFCSSLIESGIGSDWGTSISSKIRSDLISACNGQGVNKLSDTKTLEVTVPITCHYSYANNSIGGCEVSS